MRYTVYKVILILLSLLFFCILDPAALVWLIGITILGYMVGIELGDTNSRKARTLFILFIALLVSVLVIVKYMGLIIRKSLIIPLGLSYYTLMVIGYLIDVYKKDIEPEKSLINFILYTAFFPQVTAGPIGRSVRLLKQYRSKLSVTTLGIKEGIAMVICGVGEKYILADNLHKAVDKVMDSHAVGVTIFVAMLVYSLVIYYDFSGYSLIAIGVAKILGISLDTNFNSPYLATSVKDFWRRWHISLSSWFRDYLYIPLGGSRRGSIRRDINIIIVFIISGAWHGGGLGFLLWGLIHGIYLVIENRLRGVWTRSESSILSYVSDAIKRVIVYILISLAWIPFYAGDIGISIDVFRRMLSATAGLSEGLEDGFGIRWQTWAVILTGVIISLVMAVIKEHLSYTMYEVMARHGVLILCMAVMVFIVLVAAGAYGSDYDAGQFIYGGF